METHKSLNSLGGVKQQTFLPLNNAGPASVQDGNLRSVLYGYGDLPANPEPVRYLQRVMDVYSKLRDQLVDWRKSPGLVADSGGFAPDPDSAPWVSIEFRHYY